MRNTGSYLYGHDHRLAYERLTGGSREAAISHAAPINLDSYDLPKRFFGPKRSSLSSLEDQRAADLRKHVRAVTMAGDEKPMPILTGITHGEMDNIGRSKSIRLRSKRRSASITKEDLTAIAAEQEFVLQKTRLARSKSLSSVMGRTVTIQPIKTSRLDNIAPSPNSPTSPGLDPIHEDEVDELPSPRSPARAAFSNNYVQSPTKTTFDSFPPAAQVSPRKMSNGSVTTNSTMFSRESIRSEMARGSSWGSKTSFDSFEFGQWKPGGDGKIKRAEPAKRRRALSEPDEFFASLPDEVLEVILRMLKKLHLGRRSNSCATCWMRDLCNISMCSRKWYAFARVALYEDIQLIGADSAVHRKRFKMVHGPRILLLRQTLRSNPPLANLVRSLKVPRPDTTLKGVNAKSLDQYDDIVASLVMACPNLEKLRGPVVSYGHSFKKIFHALSTRKELREMDWLIESSVPSKQRIGPGTFSRTNSGLSAPARLDPQQQRAFLDHHRNWSKLSSLSIHCLPGSSLTPDSVLTRSFQALSSLQHLHLCNLPHSSFNDNTLLSLPPVETLSLTHIMGITSQGISAFATYANSHSLKKLYLHHTPMNSLPALARVLSNLPSLGEFSLTQTFPPLMPEADCFTLWMMPYLASGSVSKLHWDITSHRDCANSADDILARSIQAGGFPQLSALRAPNDPEGIFQDLCRPVERIDLPTDRFSIAELDYTSTDAGPPASPARLLQKSPKTPPPMGFPGDASGKTAFCTDLRAARLAGQARLEQADAKPRFAVTVTEEDGTVVERFGLAGFMGTLGSNIKYHLLPDRGSTDSRGGIIDPRDLTNDTGEDLTGGREGCTGSWNQREGVIADKKEKEKWWHTERGRWSNVTLAQ